MTLKTLLFAALGAAAVALTGCSSMSSQTPVPRVPNVDVARYLGPWHIIASIPLSLEKGAHNPVETYSQNPDGTIATVFQFRKDSFTGELETKPTLAEIEPNTGNAEWKVKLFGPIKGQYVISYLEADYSSAIVGRDKRDHVWILSRKPKLDDAMLESYKSKIAAMGYDTSKLYYFKQNGRQPWQ